MPKGGSGFMRAAGNAARAIFGPQSGRDWSLFNVREGVEAVQGLYGRTYRNGDVVYTYNGRGELKDIGGKNFDRFANRAEALAKELAKDVRVIDRQAEKEYRDMQRWARTIRASAEERREYDMTYRGNREVTGRGGRTGGDASEVARQMAGLGLISPGVASLGNNVDVMNAINDAMNDAKGRISTTVSSAARGDFEAEIFEGLVSRYEGVVKGANRRRRS